MTPKKKIAVLGLGPSGCAAAYILDQLEGPNVDIHLLGRDLAGRASTVTVGSDHLDLGASLFTDAYKLVPSFISALGLSGDLRPFTPTATVRHDDGRTGTLTLNEPASLIAYPLLTAKEKLELLGPLLGLITVGLLPGFDPMSLDSVTAIDEDRSLERYFQDEINQAGLDDLGKLFTGLLRTEPDLVPAATFKAWYTRPSVGYHVMTTGMGAIWSAMAASLAKRHTVESGVAVSRVSRAAGGGFTVELDAVPSPRREDYDAVILAMPAPVTSGVASGVLSPVARTVLAQRKMAESAVGIYRVHVDKSTPYAQGLLFPCGPNRHDVAVVHLHRRHKLGDSAAEEDFAYVYAHGDYSSSLAALPDAAALDALYARAQAELAGSTAWLAAKPLETVRLARHPHGTLSYPVHARQSLLSQELIISQIGSRVQLAGSFTEQPVADCMESAARSGEKAAKRLRAALFGR